MSTGAKKVRRKDRREIGGYWTFTASKRPEGRKEHARKNVEGRI